MKIQTNSKTQKLMTKSVAFDEKANWAFYYGSSLPYHRWASLPNPNGIQIPSTDKTMPKVRSLTWTAMTLFDLTTGVNPTIDGFALTANDFVVRPSSNAIITNEAEFKAYMKDHPIAIEYLLTEINWGGLK